MEKENNQTFHIFNKSIAGYIIFNSDDDYSRMIKGMDFFNNKKRDKSFSTFLTHDIEVKNVNPLVKIVAYCVMPTHFHIIATQMVDNGISDFISDLCNSYSRHFNLKHNRVGPLWQGRFKSVNISSDERLIHLTRYIHLNPVTAYLVEKPEKWTYSSYEEYRGKRKDRICEFSHLMNINPKDYEEFVNDRIKYQRELSKIKSLTLE